MGNCNKLYETEFYSTLIEEFSNIEDDPSKLELLKSNKIRELTEIFCETKDNIFYQEAMQVILSLFNDNCILPMALNSKDIEELNQEKRASLISILQHE